MKNPYSLDRIAALVLAGGKGTRMSSDGQGIDKGLQLLNAKPLVSHVLDRLAPQVGFVCINANQNLEAYEQLGYPVFPDDKLLTEQFAGPLAGLHLGLSIVSALSDEDAQCDFLVSCPCDSPFIPIDLVAKLSQAMSRDESDVAVVATQSGHQPVFLLIRTSVADHLKAFLQGGGRKIDTWYKSLKTSVVQFDDESAFDNVNTREELALAQQKLEAAKQ